MKDYFTTGDVASKVGVSIATVDRYIKIGILKPDLVLPTSSGRGGRRLFTQGTIDAFLATLSK